MDSSEETAKLAATSRLRGADAVYAAVAQRHKTVLVTRDRQQLERLASVIPTQTPEDFLSSLSTSAPTANE
jgi:predicted nucleic acid-binding protein